MVYSIKSGGFLCCTKKMRCNTFSFVNPLQRGEKEELRRLSQRMEALQLSVGQNDLPVIVLVEGWGTSGKGSRIAAMIRQMDPRFFQVVSTEAPTAEEYSWPARFCTGT